MSLVSVIIPCYNCGNWIASTLESCLSRQEFLKEIIVVDDASTDHSWEVLREWQTRYPQIIKIYKNEARGGNNARNFGFARSSGEYIQWLDADDQLLPGKWTAQVGFLKTHPEVDIVYSDWMLRTYNGDLVVKEEEKINTPANDYLFGLLTNKWSAPHCYLLRRAIAEKLALLDAWNPTTNVLQDREYFTVAAVVGAEFGYTPGIFAVYNRWSKSSVSAAGAEARFVSLGRLMNRMDEMLAQQTWPTPEKIERYRSAIDTERLLVRAAGFPSDIPRRKLAWKDLQWELVGGKKTKIRFVLEYFKWRFL